MNNIIGGMFNFHDRLQEASLNQRLVRNQVITSNVANAETPGFRAVGYSFEKQLQAISDVNEPFPLKTNHPKHLKNEYTQHDGKAHPDVYVRPTESISNDGNTVDIDNEMARLAQNQLMYRAAVELINRKVGVLRYAITSGGR